MLDTNILFSSILYRNEQIDRLFLILDNCQIVLSDKIVDEIYDVVERKRSDKIKDIKMFLNAMNYTLVKTPKDLSNTPYIRDEKDKPILAAAVSNDIDYFITGDKDFLTLEVKKPKIMSMQEFIKEFS